MMSPRRITLLLALAMFACGASAAKAPAHFKDCRDCPEMVVLPAGRFTMGSPDDEPGRKPDESPRTAITVRSFAIGRTDVTVAQWSRFVAATGHADGLGCAFTALPKAQAGTASWRNLGFKQTKHDPVVCVSWSEAQDYLRWLSAKTGHVYRLPTEAEWEYAARAGTTTVYPWGDQASHDLANYGTEECCTGLASGRDKWLNTSPVGAFPANAFGLSDMIGNAWQLTQDCYRPTLIGRPADQSAIDEPNCMYRVARGGTWGDFPALIRSAARNYAPPPGRNIPNYRSAGFGFRVVTDVVKTPAK